MQILQHASQFVKQAMNQIGKPIKAARKARPAQEPPHQTELVQNEPTFLKIAAEMQHRANGNGNDFSVGNCTANVFAVSAALEKIIDKTVYCKSAVAHIESSPLVFVW
jgi:hypothetical protein